MSFLRTNLERARLCLIHRRLPFRQFFGFGLIDKKWMKELERGLAATGKIKVGFGPVLSGEDDLNVRKWRIDPIVNCINSCSEKYFAGIFTNFETAQKFDIIVIVKNVEFLNDENISQLKQANKKLVYDIVDRPYPPSNPTANPGAQTFFYSLDGLIASSPLQQADFEFLGKQTAIIEHPILNTITKDYSQKPEDEVKIIWQGYSEHSGRLQFLHEIIQNISNELDKKITLTYHTNLLPKSNGLVRFKTWTIHNWQKLLTEADIAVEVKTLNDPFLQRKPSTKVVLYAAAGLPIVCTPSVADMLAVEHTKHAYFAHSPEEWYVYLKKLVQDAELRKTMGTLGRQHVLKNFSIQRITQKYLDFFNGL